MANVTEINRINIFDTIFSGIALYDPEIINIRVYGILDENKKCNDPLFLGADVMKYLVGSTNKRYYFKKFQPEREIVKRKIFDNNKDYCNMLTLYGLIRAVAICGKNKSKSSIAFRELIYCLFNNLKNDSLETKTIIFDSYHANIDSPEIQAELTKIHLYKTGGIVYFIKNKTTNSIKIGRTNDDIETRLSQLQTCTDCELVVVKVIECNSRIVEAQLHEKFANYHIRGEWYNITEDMI